VTGLEWLTYDQFAPRVGEGFDVGVDEESKTVPMVLAEASEGTEAGGAGPDGEQRLQFSLVFRGPQAPLLPQGTYRVTHPDMGAIALFLVPLGPDGEGMRYEAAFA
jgi:hypothetical protein